MATQTSAQRLEAAFRKGLALSSSFDVRSAHYDYTRQWDSVGHLLLVGAIEEAFGIRLAPADVTKVSSYGDAVGVLEAHGVWVDG